MEPPLRPSPRLLSAAPLILLAWQERAGRPLHGGARELAQLLSVPGEASLPDPVQLDALLTPAGKRLLDEALADPAATARVAGILRIERVPCATPPGEGHATSSAPQAWLDLTVELHQGPDGPDGLTCTAVALDISALVRAEQESAVERERYDLAIEGTGLGTWDWNPVSGTVTINRHWMGMLGEPFDTPMIDTGGWEGRIHPEDVAEAYAQLQAHIDGETEIYETTPRMRHVDGHWVHVLARGRVVERNASGEITRFSGTHTDITAQREAELAAHAATRTKTLFLATMSHEIRTPLHGILGMLQVLEGTKLTASQSEALALANSSGEHLLVLINDILEISKIEAGEFQLDPRPFEVTAWLETVANLFRSRAEDKRLSLLVDPEVEHDTWIRADDHRLRQVVGNLIANAIKFTETGTVRIEAELAPEPLRLTVRIIDTGKGIKDTARVWSQFSQEDASISRRYGGTGLGLSLSRQLIELMEGTIEVESEVGKGSTFSFTIPVQGCARLVRAVDCPSINSSERFLSLSVLVAEDNRVNRRVAGAIFKRIGLEVQFAEDGIEAVERCRETAFDLILMDLHMPNLDGFGAAEKIFEEHRSGAPAIVALSADLTEDSRERCAEIGFTGFLGKPFRVAELEAILRKHAA